MLTIQQASAGSGKTYRLAHIFIEFFLTHSGAGGKRTVSEGTRLLDNLRHILAVTFTNKATDEMKQRIVEKLAAIAVSNPECAPEDTPDYRDDLCRDTGATPQQIIDAAGRALSLLLFNYSDFNVSTIDSFFQTILRTFAYEADLNDTYQLEIDRDAVTTSAIDSILNDMIAGKGARGADKWINIIMNEAFEQGSRWNPFMQQSDRDIYGKLSKNAKMMEKEGFVEIRESLSTFFSNNQDFDNTFKELDEKYRGRVKDAYEKIKAPARVLRDAFESYGLVIKDHGCANLESRLQKSLNGDWNPSTPPALKKRDTPGSVFKSKTPNEIKKAHYADELQGLYETWFSAFANWLDVIDEIKTGWEIYRKLLPYVPLLNAIGEQISDLNSQNNTMQISDTNSILHTIIGDDEVPFIYERLGERLHHFLIDEFQDTSSMQWDNFEPLLAESLGQEHGSLIIGDAKQSIYRFRNANPDLIMHTVHDTFPNKSVLRGNTPAENTNWRSARRIVEFNNAYFKYLSCHEKMDNDIRELYANVEQNPHHQEEEGYVEVNLYHTDTSATAVSDNAGDENTEAPYLTHLGPLVSSMVERGYRLKDIAILVRTRNQGAAVVNALMQYNKILATGTPQINVISDEALLLANSRGVMAVIATLRTIAEGKYRKDTSSDSEIKYYYKKDWRHLSSLLAREVAKRPDTPAHNILMELLEERGNEDVELYSMLGNMQSVALPSLVEAIINRFVPESIKESDALYLAALQDEVMNYCDLYPADIASFLEWWDSMSSRLAITSPSDADAVTVMTIHKSKGLEFDCVIVPYADKINLDFNRFAKEWAWVRPAEGFEDKHRLPESIPIEITKSLEGTAHEQIYTDLAHMQKMDGVNLAYVGFTRAARELYVFGSMRLSRGNSIYNLGFNLEDFFSEQKDLTVVKPDEEAADSPKRTFRYGKPLSEQRIAEIAEKRADNKEKDEENSIISKYFVNTQCNFLTYKEEDMHSTPDDDDPRSEGNLLHDVLSHIKTEDDLPRALKRLEIRGLVEQDRIDRIRSLLTTALEGVRERGWFGARYRVINERPISIPDEKFRRIIRRPDRIMIDSEGNAIVVDYKTGEKESGYKRQVKRYMDLLSRTGRYASVTGYLWYLSSGEVEKVE